MMLAPRTFHSLQTATDIIGPVVGARRSGSGCRSAFYPSYKGFESPRVRSFQFSYQFQFLSNGGRDTRMTRQMLSPMDGVPFYEDRGGIDSAGNIQLLLLPIPQKCNYYPSCWISLMGSPLTRFSSDRQIKVFWGAMLL